MMALYNRDELHIKLVGSQGELKFECYKRDSFITGISFELEKHLKNTKKSGNNDFMTQKSSKFDEKTDKFTFWLKNMAKKL